MTVNVRAIQFFLISLPEIVMPSARRKPEPLLYPPLTPEIKARMRKGGHGDMIEILDNVSASTIKGLMKAARSGPVFKPKAAKRAA